MITWNGFVVTAEEEEKVLDDIMWVEERAWPPEVQASREKMRTRIEVYSEGVKFVEADARMVGVSTALRFNYDPKKPPTSWEEVTFNGWIIGTHNPDGDSLYLVSVGVAQGYQGMGLGKELVEKQKELAKERGLKWVVLGSRVPSAHLRPKDEIETVVAEDKEIGFYKKRGFEVVKIVPNYMEDDKQSRNFGVVMAWRVN